MSQRDKTKFRRSSKWKTFRNRLKRERKADEITLKPLYSHWNLHHLDLDESHYEDISDPSKFMCLNQNTHKFIHWLFIYWRKDPEIIDRIIDAMKRMC